VDRSSQIFFCLTPERSFSLTPFTLRYFHPFQKYLCLNSKVVVNCTDFLTSFAFPIFKGSGAPKSCTCITLQPKGTSSAKVSLGYTPNSEVVSASSLHFKPILDPFLKKVVRGIQVPVGGALARFGHSMARVKIWGCSTH